MTLVDFLVPTYVQMLKALSAWLEKGRWKFFGLYCFAAAAVVMLVAWRG